MADPDPLAPGRSQAPGAPWPLLAAGWEEFFPLRPPRLELALSLVPPGGRALDAGCATGSLPRALAAQGRLAHGLDLEAAFLDVGRIRAREEGVDVAWHLASLLGLAAAVGDARFHLVTCLGQTLPHLREEAQWAEFFRQVRSVLVPEGRLVIQVVNDRDLPAGHLRELPAVASARGRLERRRTMLSPSLAQMDTVFRPAEGAPVESRVHHLRMDPARAAALLGQAGLDPGPPMADEGGAPFREDSPAWILVAKRE